MDQITELLLGSLHQESQRFDRARLATLTGEDWTVLLALAAEQRVRGLLYHRLITRGLRTMIPAAATAALQRASIRTAQHNLLLQSELGRVAGALQSEGIPCI